MGRVWIKRVKNAARRYPVVAVTVVVAILGGAAARSGHSTWTAWGLSVFA
jgi:hypothetical protein